MSKALKDISHGLRDPRSGEVLISLVPRKAHVLSPSRRGWQVSLQDDEGNRRTRSVGQIVVLADREPGVDPGLHRALDRADAVEPSLEDVFFGFSD